MTAMQRTIVIIVAVSLAVLLWMHRYEWRPTVQRGEYARINRITGEVDVIPGKWQDRRK